MARRYPFSDESGDMAFKRSESASRYFAVGTLLIDHSELGLLRQALAGLRDELAWRGHGLDACFHATDDPVPVRQAVFALLAQGDFRFDVTIVEKAFVPPELRPDDATFFKLVWHHHLRELAHKVFEADDEVLIVAASIGTRRQRRALRLAVEEVMTDCLDVRVKRWLAFWRDESDFGLQAVDYCLWAVMRMLERDDDRLYTIIESRVCTIKKAELGSDQIWY